METITIPKASFGKVLDDLEALFGDLADLLGKQDQLARRRRTEIEQNPAIGLSEEELDAFLGKLGMATDDMDN